MKRLKISFLYLTIIFISIWSINIIYEKYFINCRKFAFGQCSCNKSCCKYTKI